MKFYKNLLFVVAFLLGFEGKSQKIASSAKETSDQMPLQACIDYALQNNISIKQSGLQVENLTNNFEESKFKRYPIVNGFSNFNLYQGRNINPYTNGIITNTTGSNSYGIQSSVTLFDGYQTRNNIAYNQLNLEASRLDLLAQRNLITLNVVVGYLNVLTQQDLLEVANRQVEVTKIQTDRTEKLVRAGSSAETALYDIKAQLANDELSVVNAQNNLESARLTLKQILNMAADRDIQVVRVEVPNPNVQVYPNSSQQVYEVAQGFLPDIQAADLRIKLAQKNIDIAKAFKLPTVSANAALQSNASTAAQQSSGQFVPTEQNFGSVNVNGTDFPLIVKSQSPILEGIPFTKQISGNFNSSVGLTVRVPILNGYNANFRMAAAKIQTKNAEYQADNARITLRQSIEQAYINMSNASKRYSAIQNQVTSLEQAFRAAESKFNVGSLNSLDYNISKTNLDRAKSNLIQSKYDYIFRTKILDYYQNKPLSF